MVIFGPERFGLISIFLTVASCHNHLTFIHTRRAFFPSSLRTCGPSSPASLLPQRHDLVVPPLNGVSSMRGETRRFASLTPKDPSKDEPRRPAGWVKLVKLLKRLLTKMAARLQRKSMTGLFPGRLVRPSLSWKLISRLVALVASFSLATSMAGAGRSPSPVEIPYSDFLRVVDKKPARIQRVMISPSRWDFMIELPAPAVEEATADPKVASAAESPAAPESKTVPSAIERFKVSAAAKVKSRRMGGAAVKTGPTVIRGFTRPVLAHQYMIEKLSQADIPFKATSTTAQKRLAALFPLIYLGGILGFYSRTFTKMGGGAGKKVESGALPPGSGFEGVAGMSSSKAEVSEIVEMLKFPERYVAVGARLPSGILLVGPPGTGKTLLARAVAAEAQVPFFFCSGSDFVEMYVGRGAARVRQLFKDATKSKSTASIIFVDELDAIGKSRNSVLGLRDNSEAEQTLNQLLACMDGLDTSNNGVIVIAATNRFAVLDDALTRPGRFDRVVNVGLPDEEGRRAILKVHMAKDMRAYEEPMDDIAVVVAKLTPGACGADLAALVNEAAIRAVRRGANRLSTGDFVDAIQQSNQGRGSQGDPVTQLLKRFT